MKQWEFIIDQNELIAKDTYELKLTCEGFTASPGQFVALEIPNAGQLTLRRPLSIHKIEPDGLRIQYQPRGEGTTLLTKAKAGQSILATAPLGSGYKLSGLENIWLIGGGIGVPPLYTIASTGKATHTFVGFKNAEYIIDEELFKSKTNLHLYTDDGSAGIKGFAIDGIMELLNSEKPDAIMACGPLPMYRALKARLPEDVPCFVSLEERMGCAIGACLVCSCKVNGKKQRVCSDGPVFNLREVEL